MKLLKKIITLLIVFSAMNINMLYGDVVYDFGTHVIMCFGDGDGHGGYLVGECITFYRDDQKREENNSGGGSGTTGTSGSSTFTPTPTTTEPTGGSGGTTGGTGTSGDDIVTDKPTLDDNKPPLEEPEPICRCSECEVCGGCLLSDVPEACEPCTCPDAPNKVNLCSGGQTGLMSILNWFEHICNLFSINSSINVRTEDVVDMSKCMGTGTAGAYKNGFGSVMGITVRWQVSYAGLSDTDQYLRFNTTDERDYYRAILTQNGKMGAPGITLLFTSKNDRDRVMGSIPCLN